MSNLIHETERIERLPEAFTKEGYKPPAFVRVYEAGEGKYEIQPCIGFDFMGANDFLDKAITTLPVFEGSEEGAIAHGKRILEDLENWPKY